MVTQVPALKIEYWSPHLQTYHKKMGYHPHLCAIGRVYQGQVPVEEIACYLWPGLFDGGGRLIRAGEVLCRITN